MGKIHTLIGNLEQAVRDAVKYDDITREDAVAAWGIAITQRARDGVWWK